MRLSLGSAAKLGLAKINQLAEPTTCYIMVGGQCKNNCSFCAQSIDASRLSRIEWIKFDDDLIINKVNKSDFKRVCLQCTSVGIVKVAQLIQEFNRPTSISYNFQSIEEINSVKDADKICIPLDAASSKVFAKTKMSDFENRLHLLKQAADKYPGKISTHLILGLGETEEDAEKIITELHEHGINIGLFAFTPIPGTKMEDIVPPDIRYYRRMQQLNYKLKHGHVDKNAYKTSGCEGCNRPYYNETPGGQIYNYP